MNQVTELIKNAFANLPYNIMKKIRYQGYDFYVLRKKTEFGVALEIPEDIVFSGKFASAKLFTEPFILRENGQSSNFLVLSSKDERSRNEFATICANFIEPGENGEYREMIQNDPSFWWNTWKELIGNTIKNRTPYAIIGEMLLLESLANQKRLVISWSGPKHGTHDIETNQCDFEIKSSLSRYETNLQISGQHQLLQANNKPLWIIFYRLERTEVDGTSINSMVERCCRAGFNGDLIEDMLESSGYEIGEDSRTEMFKVLEIRCYLVDANFPVITFESFKNERMSDFCKKFSYELDGSALRFISLEEMLNKNSF
jgi:hypothetical protein